MSGKLAVIIDASLHNELVLRTRRADDVSQLIEHAIRSFLDRTENDGTLWSHEYIHESTRDSHNTSAELGSPNKGYVWAALMVPNGSRLRMTYKSADYFAIVAKEEIMYEGKSYTPSELARYIAGNTNRNAWRDFYIQLPGQKTWRRADALRQTVTGH
jgi:hypothetical protein